MFTGLDAYISLSRLSEKKGTRLTLLKAKPKLGVRVSGSPTCNSTGSSAETMVTLIDETMATQQVIVPHQMTHPP